jgi:MFS transporter, PPP family, 3-phenylpropionic acid transporter
MPSESQIPMPSQLAPERFAVQLALFYAAVFGLVGTYLPFFPVWLKAVGIDASWIGIITAVPAVTRFTVLPLVTGLAESRQRLRGAMMATAFMTAFGFLLVGTQQAALLVFLAFAVTACVWTPVVPLTDAYALHGVARYGLDYGPVRLWGSAAFIVGALACGLLVDVIAARHLIWIIAALAGLGAVASLGLRPLDMPKAAASVLSGAPALLRDPGFLAIIVASALIQGSHAAYYIFASIVWQQSGLGGLTIAGLWSLGVIAEIVVFALSHGLTYGLTQVGTMGLLVRHVPGHVTARGQGYLAACSGIIASTASILSGAVYARYGQGVYYVMAAMAASGAVVMWLARQRLADHPQSEASGG